MRTLVAVFIAFSFCVFHPTVFGTEIPGFIQKILSDNCQECHDDQAQNGALNLSRLVKEFRPRKDIRIWEIVEAAIAQGKMPPPDEGKLSAVDVTEMSSWFSRQFIFDGGVQHPGPTRPRKLTREELQNSLEDLLYVDLRPEVTNSRLHVIPETIIEKFFTAGIIGDSGFSNDAEGSAKETIEIQTYVRCFSLVLSLMDHNQEALQHFFHSKTPPQKLTTEQASQIIQEFGDAAFRRELSSEEVSAFKRVFEKMRQSKSDYGAIKSSFLAILLSPEFLYRFEKAPSQKIEPLTNRELAIRLSYFLWSAPPDAELLERVQAGTLSNSSVLKKQVNRMLADPKRIALAENLGGEWFDYKQLRRQSMVNRRSDKLAGFYRTQYEEALLFFDSIIRFNQPIHSLVEANWAYINRHQANIYGFGMEKLDTLSGESLPPVNLHYRTVSRKIKTQNYEYRHAPLELARLTDANRGGFLTLGSTLSATSTENRTSPIRRGVWVMEKILGEHFVQPADVPDLETAEKKAKQQKQKLSAQEVIRLHSSADGCSACHQYIDPIGFGLEGFDQFGITRRTSAMEPTGEKHYWDPKTTPNRYTDQSWDLTRPLVPGTSVKVYFQYSKGPHRLNIKDVRLQSGAVELVDKHFGYTGANQLDNVWTFSIPKDAPASQWRLTASIEGDQGGTNSSGTITIGGPGDQRPSYQLPNGSKFSTPAELRSRLLADYKDQITDNMIKRFLAYAVGRRVLPIDRPAIAAIKEKLSADEYRINTLIEAVVMSYPFRHKEMAPVE